VFDEHLERWTLAYAGLSAAWSMEDGDDPASALAVAAIARAELASPP
jgi:streptomycin 6-kinase